MSVNCIRCYARDLSGWSSAIVARTTSAWPVGPSSSFVQSGLESLQKECAGAFRVRFPTQRISVSDAPIFVPLLPPDALRCLTRTSVIQITPGWTYTSRCPSQLIVTCRWMACGVTSEQYSGTDPACSNPTWDLSTHHHWLGSDAYRSRLGSDHPRFPQFSHFS